MPMSTSKKSLLLSLEQANATARIDVAQSAENSRGQRAVVDWKVHEQEKVSARPQTQAIHWTDPQAQMESQVPRMRREAHQARRGRFLLVQLRLQLRHLSEVQHQ